ncbi:hypothetical protein [Microcoleus sp. S13_C5]|uniref:hypothetical protein n=1 Tax=Microcoleus sp. S13_C5 TaxID=3055411 RepID=UPI002FD09CF4
MPHEIGFGNYDRNQPVSTVTIRKQQHFHKIFLPVSAKFQLLPLLNVAKAPEVFVPIFSCGANDRSLAV